MVVVVLGTVIVAGRSVLSQSFGTFRDIEWQWVPLALLAEASSMGAFARMQRRLLRVGGLRLRLISTLAVTYAGNAVSLSLPVAGGAASAGFVFHQFRRLGADAPTASWALGASWAISTFTFGVTLAAGALTTGNGVAALAGLLSALALVLPLVMALAGVRRGWVHATLVRWATWAQRAARRWGSHENEEAPLVPVDEFLQGLASIRMPFVSAVETFGLSLWNWTGSVLCLVCCILATGGAVPWHGLLLAYGAGAGAALVPLTPGGVGVVELALSAALVVAGMHGPHAVAAVLVFRLVSFWLVVAIGWAVMAFLFRSDWTGRTRRRE